MFIQVIEIIQPGNGTKQFQ